MKLAVDMSKWGGELTDAEAQCLVSKGYTRVIVGISDTTLARKQMLAAKRAGLEVQGYSYVYFTDNPVYYVTFAIQKCGDLIDFLWIDVEDTASAGLKTTSQREAAIHQCEAYCQAQGMPCGIYTSKHMWSQIMGASTAFAHLPLWNAFYDNDPDIDFQKHPYGGWPKAVMEQYGNTQYVCGQSVDVNSYEDSEDAMWHRLNGRADFFSGKVLSNDGLAVGTMQLAIDFPTLPATARAVDLDVYLAPDSAGDLVFLDGDRQFAGKVTRRAPHQVIRVVPNDKRQVFFDVEGPSAKTELVGVLGYEA